MIEIYGLFPENKELVSTKSKQSEEKKLELRLGPPGDQVDQSLVSNQAWKNNNNHEPKWVFEEAIKPKVEEEEQLNWLMSKGQSAAADSKCQNLSSYSEITTPQKTSSAQWSSAPLTFQRETQWKQQQQQPPPPPSASAASKLLDSAASKRTERAPAVIGWPPVRSSRKNLGSSSSKSCSKTTAADNETKCEEGGPEHQHLFVKINMEGIPIGRKVDLKAYDSYQKLSLAIDQLFQGLLAAQKDYSSCEKENKYGLDGKLVGDDYWLRRNGEYTLVYEDHEGDRMLVGDVPWQMFVSTAKRLRVLKSLEISTLRRRGDSQNEKTPLDAEMEIEIGR